MTRRIPFTAAILALLSSPQPGFAQSAVAEHAGRCDASAAIAVAPNLFVVANDEDNVLRAYRLGEPAPVGEWDLNSFLKTAPKNEVDIEGVEQGSATSCTGSAPTAATRTANARASASACSRRRSRPATAAGSTSEACTSRTRPS